MLSIYCQSILAAEMIKEKIDPSVMSLMSLFVVDGECSAGRTLTTVLVSKNASFQQELMQVQCELEAKSNELLSLRHHHRISATLMKGSRAISRQQYHDYLASSHQSVQAAEAVLSIIQKRKQSLLLRRQKVTDWMYANWLEIGKVFLSMQSFIQTATTSNLAMTLLDPSVFLLSQRSDLPCSQIMRDSKTFLSSYHSMWLQVSDYCQAVNRSQSTGGDRKTFRVLVSDTQKQAMMRELLMSYLFLIPHGLAVFVDSVSSPDQHISTLSSGAIRNSTNEYFALSSVFTQFTVVSLEGCHEDSSDCFNLCSVM